MLIQFQSTLVFLVSALRDFFKYFKDIWVHSGENKWYEGSAPHRSNNNQGIEAVN